MFNVLGVKETQKDSFVYYIIFKYIIIHTCVYESYLYVMKLILMIGCMNCETYEKCTLLF